MPDESVPPYELILEQVQNFDHCMIGTSWYYIHADDYGCCLCRIVYGGGKIYFHEKVDHAIHGISHDDIREAVRLGQDSFSLEEYYPISPHIGQKLRVLED
jgi:hypothetical protein